MKTMVFFLLVVIPSLAVSQSVSDQTNRIVLNYNGAVTPTVLPVISWTKPMLEFTHSVENSVEIEVEINSEMELREVTLTILNKGDSIARKIPTEQTQRKHPLKQKLYLMEGNNIVRIIAVNDHGAKVISDRTILVGKDALANIDINRKDYALIFGIDNYDNYSELVNPIDDGRTIELLLKEKYGFVTEVMENATLQEINNKIYDYTARKYHPQDQLFIFFAGHGQFDETLNEGYVVASDSRKDDKGKTSYLAHSLLRSSLDKIPCPHIFLTMDVCFGGTFDPKLSGVRADEMTDEDADKKYLANKLIKRTRKFLTSGSKDYVSDGIQGKHSPFAAKFIQALREIGGGGGRLLTLNELNTYFQKLPGEPRSGSFGSDESNSDFVFVAK